MVKHEEEEVLSKKFICVDYSCLVISKYAVWHKPLIGLIECMFYILNISTEIVLHIPQVMWKIIYTPF